MRELERERLGRDIAGRVGSTDHSRSAGRHGPAEKVAGLIVAIGDCRPTVGGRDQTAGWIVLIGDGVRNHQSTRRQQA